MSSKVWQPPSGLKYTTHTVNTEGCRIYYEIHPSSPMSGRPPLIYIPGAGAQGLEYLPTIPYLKEHFTCIAYDRRQQGRSKLTESGEPYKSEDYVPYNPIQQARDLIAVLKAAGYSKASVWGNSAGGQVGLQIAASFPEYVDRVIVHEAPACALLPDGDYWIDSTYKWYNTFKREGLQSAMTAFRSNFKGFSADDAPGPQASEEDWNIAWQCEILTIVTYIPDLQRIRNNKVHITIATGAKSKGAFYAETGKVLAERLQCREVVFPSHHSGHQCEPEAFAKMLLQILLDT